MGTAESVQDSTQTIERRSSVEPVLAQQTGQEEFPELTMTAAGASRARAAVRMMLKDYFSDAQVKAALMGCYVRHFTAYEGQLVASYAIIASGKEPSAQWATPAIDGQALFQRYSTGETIADEDIKDVLFAIRREARRLSNTGHEKLSKLERLSSMAIYELQLQRRKDVGI